MGMMGWEPKGDGSELPEPKHSWTVSSQTWSPEGRSRASGMAIVCPCAGPGKRTWMRGQTPQNLLLHLCMWRGPPGAMTLCLSVRAQRLYKWCPGHQPAVVFWVWRHTDRAQQAALGTGPHVWLETGGHKKGKEVPHKDSNDHFDRSLVSKESRKQQQNLRDLDGSTALRATPVRQTETRGRWKMPHVPGRRDPWFSMRSLPTGARVAEWAVPSCQCQGNKHCLSEEIQLERLFVCRYDVHLLWTTLFLAFSLSIESHLENSNRFVVVSLLVFRLPY